MGVPATEILRNTKLLLWWNKWATLVKSLIESRAMVGGCVRVDSG